MQANLHGTNLDNLAFMIVMIAYLGFAAYVFVQRKRLLQLPEGSGS
jgi:hypothetical protein